MLQRYRAWNHNRKVEKATRALHRAFGQFPSHFDAMFEIQSILAHQSTDKELKEFRDWLIDFTHKMERARQ